MVRKEAEIKRIVKDLCALLKKDGIHIERAILFGSYARNEAHDDSDIDLVLVSRDFSQFAPLERLEYLSIVSWKLPAPLEILGYTPDEVEGREGQSILWDEILNTGKIIYEAA